MVSVWNIIDSPSLSLIGHYLPDPEATVRWTAASELADPTPFLEGGELLLTTGVNTQDWTSQWRDYVRLLKQAGVVAIGLGTGLTYERVPSPLLAACREHGVNLVEVPPATTFVSVTQQTARMLFRGEQAQAHEALMVQHDLALTALDRDNPSELLRTLSEIIGGGAGLLSAEGSFVAGPHGETIPDDTYDFDQQIRQMRPRGLRSAASASGPDGVWLIQPIGLSGRPERYLAVWSSVRFNDSDRGAISTAATLLSLAAESQHDRRETNRRLRFRATELLLSGDVRTAEVLLATTTGEDPAESILPDVAQVAVVGAGANGRDGFENTLDEALTVLEGVALGVDGPLLASLRHGLHIVLRPEQTDTAIAAIGSLGLRIGIGSEQEPARLHMSRVQAEYALEQATALNPVTRWDHLMDAGALAFMGEAAAEEFARSFLRPLHDHPELMETLHAFLRHHGSRGKAAETLGIHRNTVRHRLAEVEELLGRSLDDPHIRVNAWLALQVDATQRLQHDLN